MILALIHKKQIVTKASGKQANFSELPMSFCSGSPPRKKYRDRMESCDFLSLPQFPLQFFQKFTASKGCANTTVFKKLSYSDFHVQVYSVFDTSKNQKLSPSA